MRATGFFSYVVSTFSLARSQIPPSFTRAARFCVCRISDGTLPREVNLSLHDSVPCVVNRIAFVLAAVVGDALDHDFGVVASARARFA